MVLSAWHEIFLLQGKLPFTLAAISLRFSEHSERKAKSGAAVGSAPPGQDASSRLLPGHVVAKRFGSK